ncbi:nuclear pore complex protein DDB_G0274915 isoform X2 [Odontomachus brunneus]|uniref:nuclear pore complex protein DDB_G0274915 isoform X2 n=1 Tax=Odontomachus brunneus TaxID=486640 RepID=UPI0013F18D34|nr:nuclear pore complex protein DDB_G0274915 isoform X2 [Odontomachus brunneus]
MWNLGNRAAVVLICVTCGCVLVYNAWGAILALVLSLLLVVYACYSLLANDSLVSPQAYYVLVYLREAIVELHAALDSAVSYVSGYVRKFWHSASRYYRDRFPFRMDKRRSRDNKSYQLSSDSYTTAAIRTRDSVTPTPSSLSTRFSPIDQLGQIRRNTYQASRQADTTYHRFCPVGDHERSLQLILGKHTSTPVFRPADRDDFSNGDICLSPAKTTSPLYTQSHKLSHGENITQFSPDGSPWGTSISPKMRPRPAGMKTVQTVAGPLLASTRYNIDPKLYTDVLSPGLTTRLTKYATEAKNTLTHQSHYGTGQFPKVNLHVSPIPLVNTKSTKLRMPVTVRLAPPEVTRYSPPERQRLLSNIRHAPSNKSTTSVVQVLRDISLKRHASREDVTFDVAKKQRTEDLFDEETEMVLEETKQKRSRDDSKSDEELSPQNISIRPAKKRTKTQSCYDILNSLSSSIHVSSGIKRKAIDFSRSGTPDFEKHFKSLKSTQSSNSRSLNSPQSQNLDISHSHRPEIKEIYSRSPETLTCDKIQETLLTKGILKTPNNESKFKLNKPVSTVHKNTKSVEIRGDAETVAPTKSVKLADKLFMKDEPERNEWLKLLVEEQGSVKATFAKNNVEEIKREDIRNMRQTSMKARLQSMFDAISGKAESRINPDVVIQADVIQADVNEVAPVVTSSQPGSRATLNSSTTTTTVNTTPISTAAIVPGGTLTSKPDTKPAAIFCLPNPASSAQSNAPTIITPESKVANVKPKINAQAKIATTTAVSTESLPKDLSSTSSAITPMPPTFVFGKQVTETSPTVTSSTLPSFGAHNVSNSILETSTVATTATPTVSTFTNFLSIDKTPSTLAFVPISSSSAPSGKVETNNTATTSANAISFITASTANTQASSMFAFATSKLSASTATPKHTLASNLPPQFTGTTSLPTSISMTNIAGFTSIASNVLNSIATTTTTSAPAQMPLFSFGGGSIASQPPKSSSIFGLGQSGGNIQSTNAFGNIANSQATSSLDTSKSFSFTSNNSAVTTTNSSFSTTTTMTTTATPAFGLSSTPTFTLGTSAPSIPSVIKPLFVFGTTSVTSATSTPITIASGTTAFGAMSNNTVAAFGTTTTIATPQFGTPATTASQFGAPTISAPQFGTSATSRFGTLTTSASQFGPATTSIFGNTSVTTTTTTSIFSTTNSQTVFGANTSTTGTTSIFNSPMAASIFPATTSVLSADSTAANNLFAGKANVNTNNSTTASAMFGNVTAPIFGQTKPSTSFSTANASIFGNTSTSLFGATQTTSAPTFGITNVSTSSAITSAFDSSVNNTTSAFGSASGAITTNAPQNTSVSAFGSTNNMFGSTDNTSTPLFGASTSEPAGRAFASTANTSAFGGQNPANLTFGVSSGGSGGGTTFSDNKPLFGTMSSTSAGTFGNLSLATFGAENAGNTSNNASGMFFGNNQKDGQQQAAGFGFASNFNAGSNNPTTASPAPFQFGSTTTKPATGFNFTAPSPTPTINFGTSGTPAFNPATPGMFSIGTGSSAPRSRSIRTRKPR